MQGREAAVSSSSSLLTIRAVRAPDGPIYAEKAAARSAWEKGSSLHRAALAFLKSINGGRPL